MATNEEIANRTKSESLRSGHPIDRADVLATLDEATAGHLAQVASPKQAEGMILLMKDGRHRFMSRVPLGAECVWFNGDENAAYFEPGDERMAKTRTLSHALACPKSATEMRGRVAVEDGLGDLDALRIAISLIPCATCQNG